MSPRVEIQGFLLVLLRAIQPKAALCRNQGLSSSSIFILIFVLLLPNVLDEDEDGDEDEDCLHKAQIRLRRIRERARGAETDNGVA